MAGDGKLGGLVDPNDGLCHLNSSGFYEWSTIQGESRNVSRVGEILFFQEGQHQGGHQRNDQ